MKVKISPKVLSISPHISTPWKNIASLQVKEGTLMIFLTDETHVKIPSLDQVAIDSIFEAHARYAVSSSPFDSPYSFSLPFSSDGQILPPMSHNPQQADLAPLPPEVLQKIATIAKALGLEDSNQLPQAEPNCSCLFCQVVRTMQGEKEEEPFVDDKELTFRSWDVQQTADKLYIVVNPLDKNEQYNVFLGEPLGCTCGQKNCDHIRAVLST